MGFLTPYYDSIPLITLWSSEWECMASQLRSIDRENVDWGIQENSMCWGWHVWEKGVTGRVWEEEGQNEGMEYLLGWQPSGGNVVLCIDKFLCLTIELSANGRMSCAFYTTLPTWSASDPDKCVPPNDWFHSSLFSLWSNNGIYNAFANSGITSNAYDGI